MDTTKDINKNTVNVVGYKDNPDGTTTNFLSDGTQDTGKLSPNNDGSYSFNPIGQNIPTTITSDMLNASPTPLKLPEQKTSTLASGVIGSATVANEQVMKNLEAERAKAEKVKTESGFDVQNIINQAIGIQGSRVQEEQNANLPKLREDLTAITNEIDSVQRAYQNELKALDSSNMTDAGRDAASRGISRKYASQLADLSIVQSARNRNLSTAQANVDRKIELQLEPLKLKLDYQKSVYEDNKDSFTKADDRKYQALIKSTERDLNKEEERVKTLENTKLKFMDIASSLGKDNSVFIAMSKATSPEEVLSIASKNGVISLDDQYKAQQVLKTEAEKKKILAETTYNNNPIVKDSPLVDAMYNVNAGTAEGQQKRDLQKIASLVSDGKTKEAKQLIMSRVTSKMSTTERDAQLDRRNTIDALEDMQSALNEYVSLSGNTNILKGSIEDVANKIGTTSDPRLASIKTRIIQATQKYRNSITGAAWGDQEDAEYKTIFPSIKNTSKLNNTIIDTMVPLLKNNERNSISAFLGGTDIYDTVFGGGDKNQDPLGLGIGGSNANNNPLGI